MLDEVLPVFSDGKNGLSFVGSRRELVWDQLLTSPLPNIHLVSRHVLEVGRFDHVLRLGVAIFFRQFLHEVQLPRREKCVGENGI